MFCHQKDSDLQYILSHIRYNVNPPKKIYTCTPDEEAFVEALISHLRNHQKHPRSLELVRMSDGKFNIFWKRDYIGKIQLQGKKKYFQYMKNLLNSETVYGETVEDLLPYITKICL